MFLKQTAYKPKSRTSSQSSVPPTPDSPTTTSSSTTDPSPNTNPKPRTASQTWEDRRFMWQTGASGGRKSSVSAAAASGDGSAATDPAPAAQQKSSSPFAMSKPNTSENPHPTTFVKGEGAAGGTGATAALRDRHFIWSKGKEVHEGAGERRKSSASSPTAKSGIMASLLGNSGGAGTGK